MSNVTDPEGGDGPYALPPPDPLTSPTNPAYADDRQAALRLWAILDSIDTASDQAKGNDGVYRAYVEKRVRDRFAVFASDGYHLFRVPAIGPPIQVDE